jgi:hypothetical protein
MKIFLMSTITKYSSFEALKKSSLSEFSKQVSEPKYFKEYKEFIELLRKGNTNTTKKKSKKQDVQ